MQGWNLPGFALECEFEITKKRVFPFSSWHFDLSHSSNMSSVVRLFPECTVCIQQLYSWNPILPPNAESFMACYQTYVGHIANPWLCSSVLCETFQDEKSYHERICRAVDVHRDHHSTPNSEETAAECLQQEKLATHTLNRYFTESLPSVLEDHADEEIHKIRFSREWFTRFLTFWQSEPAFKKKLHIFLYSKAAYFNFCIQKQKNPAYLILDPKAFAGFFYFLTQEHHFCIFQNDR